MKRLAVFLAAMAGLTLAIGSGAQSHDAAELVPAQAFVIDVEQGEITVTADTGDAGSGATLDAAFSDLRAACAGTLFTQTAEHVILTQRAWYLMPQVSLSAQLRPAAKLYRAIGTVEEPEKALAFLQAHPGELTLNLTRAALLAGKTPEAPVLMQTGGSFRLGR